MGKDIAELLRKVELESYSSSETFLGYCESKRPNTYEECNVMVDIFFDSLISVFGPPRVVSSLFIEDEISNLSVNYDLSRESASCLKRLLDANLMKARNEIYEASGDSEEGAAEYDKIVRELVELNCGQSSLIRDLLVTVMHVDGVDGHLFIAFPDFDFLVYPHDEFGFGFLCDDLNVDKVKICIKESFMDASHIHFWDKVAKQYETF